MLNVLGKAFLIDLSRERFCLICGRGFDLVNVPEARSLNNLTPSEARCGVEET